MRDVAAAHVLAALELPNRNDRFLINSESIWYKDLVQILKDNKEKIGYSKEIQSREIGYMTLKLGSFVYSDLKGIIPFLNKEIDIQSSKELTINHSSIKESLVEMAI